MKKLQRVLCGAAADLGWYSVQLLAALCFYSPAPGLPEMILAIVQLPCWAAQLYCVKAGIWKGPAVPALCGIFALIDLWWIVDGLQRVLWYYYDFPQPRLDDVLGILGILFCAVGMCVNLTAGILEVRSRKKANRA